MLEILIIDDEPRKVIQVKNVIEEFSEIPATSVFVAKSQIEGKKLLSQRQFDLVILDIQLPLRENDVPQEDGGIVILREIHSRTRYKKPHCILGLTAYPERLEAAAELFAGNLWSILLFEDKSSFWQELLHRRIEYLIELHHCNKMGKEYKTDIGIITALGDPEFDSILKLADWEDVNVLADDTKYFSSAFKNNNKNFKVIASCLPQMGMPAAAVSATKMITHFSPRYLAMTGITAGVRGKVELGDILIADPCWDWGNGKITHEGDIEVLKPDPLQHRVDSHLSSIFHCVQRDKDILFAIWDNWRGTKPKHPPKLHIGPCASGPCVLANKDFVRDIQDHSRKLIGIDMEAYGLMHAAAHSTLPHPFTFSMKGVSDFADEYKDDSYRNYAAYVSATLLKLVSLNYFLNID